MHHDHDLTPIVDGELLSWNTMIVVDIAIIAMFAALVTIVFYSKQRLAHGPIQIGLTLLLLGSSAIAAIYVYDLYTMLVLPHFIGMPAAMEEMARLHSVYSWYLPLIGMPLILAGIAAILIGSVELLKKMSHLMRAAQEATEAKSAFLASASHELRTPLNAISGFAEMMYVLPAGRNEKWYRENAQLIHDSSGHLKRLVEGLLDLSRIESGSVDYNFQTLNLEDLTESLHTVLDGAFSQKQLQFKVDFSPEAKTVRADAQAIRQVLINLLANAAKHTPESGRIEVTSERLCSKQIRIEVRDNGCGIDPTVRDKIFTPFATNNPYLTHERPGHGLGLAISKGIVEGHNGSIRIGETSSAGTAIWLELPSPS